MDSSTQKRLEERNKQHQPLHLVDPSSYTVINTKYDFVCDAGHVTSFNMKDLLSAKGAKQCPICKRERDINERRDGYFAKIAEKQIDVVRVDGKRADFLCKVCSCEWNTLINVAANMTGCPECSKRTRTVGKRTASLKKFKEFVDTCPFTIKVPPFEEWDGVHTEVEAECVCGHKWNPPAQRLMSGYGCAGCAGTAKKTTDVLESILEKHNETRKYRVSLVPGEQYTGSHNYVRARCSNGHEWDVAAYLLIAGNGCAKCGTKQFFSQRGVKWMDTLATRLGIHIQHGGNGGEYFIPETSRRADGFCADTNTVYEFYGNYWHGNPAIHDLQELNPTANKTYEELFLRTYAREKEIIKAGYKIVSVWEEDWYRFTIRTPSKLFVEFSKRTGGHITENTPNTVRIEDTLYVTLVEFQRFKNINYACFVESNHIVVFEDEWEKNPELVLSRIRNRLGINNVPRVHARQCDIRPIKAPEKNQFLGKFHVQGADKATVAYGAFHGNTLIAVMTFCKPRSFMNKSASTSNNEMELSRFATDINYKIPGIASKLFAQFCADYPTTVVYTFSNTRWGTGNVYEQMGFKYVTDTPQEYYYLDGGVRKHRWAYRKQELESKYGNPYGLDEKWLAKMNNIDVLYGLSNKKFIHHP